MDFRSNLRSKKTQKIQGSILIIELMLYCIKWCLTPGALTRLSADGQVLFMQ